jgi:hypothetical protein
MVGWDMVARLRPTFGVIAGLALVMAAALIVVGRDASGATGLELSSEPITVVEQAATRPSVTPRAPSPVTTPIGVAAVLCLATLWATSLQREAHQRVRPCLDDVGDTWRSLLLGAPPARL